MIQIPIYYKLQTLCQQILNIGVCLCIIAELFLFFWRVFVKKSLRVAFITIYTHFMCIQLYFDRTKQIAYCTPRWTTLKTASPSLIWTHFVALKLVCERQFIIVKARPSTLRWAIARCKLLTSQDLEIQRSLFRYPWK